MTASAKVRGWRSMARTTIILFIWAESSSPSRQHWPTNPSAWGGQLAALIAVKMLVCSPQHPSLIPHSQPFNPGPMHFAMISAYGSDFILIELRGSFNPMDVRAGAAQTRSCAGPRAKSLYERQNGLSSAAKTLQRFFFFSRERRRWRFGMADFRKRNQIDFRQCYRLETIRRLFP